MGLTCSESYDPPSNMSSTSSELSSGTDLTLGECREDRNEPGDLGGLRPTCPGAFTERDSMDGILCLPKGPLFELGMFGEMGVASCRPIRGSTGSGDCVLCMWLSK
jgi:hypothetical protein